MLGDAARLPEYRNESSSEGNARKHLSSQSHRYKPASVSPPRVLLNVFTRAPLSVPFCNYKAFVFDAWAIWKDIPLFFPTPLPSSHTEELINNTTLPLSPGKGSPYDKTWRDHTVTLCETVQDEAIKAGIFIFFSKQRTHSAWGCWWLPVAATIAVDRDKTAAGWEICLVVRVLYLGCQQSIPAARRAFSGAAYSLSLVLLLLKVPLTRVGWSIYYYWTRQVVKTSYVVCGVLHPCTLTANGIACPIPSSCLHEISLPPFLILSLLCHPDWSVTFISTSH